MWREVKKVGQDGWAILTKCLLSTYFYSSIMHRWRPTWNLPRHNSFFICCVLIEISVLPCQNNFPLTLLHGAHWLHTYYAVKLTTRILAVALKPPPPPAYNICFCSGNQYKKGSFSAQACLEYVQLFVKTFRERSAETYHVSSIQL